MAEYFSSIAVRVSCNVASCINETLMNILPGEDRPPYGFELPPGWTVSHATEAFTFLCPKHKNFKP